MLSTLIPKIRFFLDEAKALGKSPLIVILGPSASGKTALSLDLAQKFNGEIVSADSRQIYRYMDIGTDKIMPENRRGIPHHMIDIADPRERFTLSDFKNKAIVIIKDILKRGKIPFLVGGTGLYIRAVTQNFDIPLGENLKLRAELARELAEKGENFMHEKLKELDPSSAAKIHPHNHRYLLRALEINLTHGKKVDRAREPEFISFQIGLDWNREKLYERINKRADQQIARGLVHEVETLLGMGYSPDLPSMSSLGYREIIKFLRKEISLEEATELIKQNTRNYAKRQMTWFKKDKDVKWSSIGRPEGPLLSSNINKLFAKQTP